MRKKLYCLFIAIALSGFSYSQNQAHIIKAQAQLDEMTAYYQSIEYALDSAQIAKIFNINYMILDKIDSFLNENTLSEDLMNEGVAERKALRRKLIKEQLNPAQAEKYNDFVIIYNITN